MRCREVRAEQAVGWVCHGLSSPASDPDLGVILRQCSRLGCRDCYAHGTDTAAAGPQLDAHTLVSYKSMQVSRVACTQPRTCCACCVDRSRVTWKCCSAASAHELHACSKSVDTCTRLPEGRASEAGRALKGTRPGLCPPSQRCLPVEC